MKKLIIDCEFAGQIPPLTEEEFRQLEDNILSDREVIHPIIIWDGIIVDGHNRYRILEKHPEIPFQTFEKSFSNRNEAMAWICRNQLGRRNLSSVQRKYLMGKQYHEEKATHGASDGFRGNQYVVGTGGQNDHLPGKTAERIAKQNHTSERTVRRNEKFALGVEAADEAVPGTKQQILSGELCPVDSAVNAVAAAPPEERESLARRLHDPDVQQRGKHRTESEEERVTRVVAEDMEAVIPRHKVNENSMLETLRGVTHTMIRSCNRCFDLFPTLLTDEHYREQVLEIMNEPKAYILNLESGGDNSEG